jgi:hypothetical protein
MITEFLHRPHEGEMAVPFGSAHIINFKSLVNLMLLNSKVFSHYPLEQTEKKSAQGFL